MVMIMGLYNVRRLTLFPTSRSRPAKNRVLYTMLNHGNQMSYQVFRLPNSVTTLNNMFIRRLKSSLILVTDLNRVMGNRVLHRIINRLSKTLTRNMRPHLKRVRLNVSKEGNPSSRVSRRNRRSRDHNGNYQPRPTTRRPPIAQKTLLYGGLRLYSLLSIPTTLLGILHHGRRRRYHRNRVVSRNESKRTIISGVLGKYGRTRNARRNTRDLNGPYATRRGRPHRTRTRYHGNRTPRRGTTNTRANHREDHTYSSNRRYRHRNTTHVRRTTRTKRRMNRRRN